VRPQHLAAADRVLNDLSTIDSLTRVDARSLRFDDQQVLAVERLWIDIGHAFSHQLGLSPSDRMQTPVKRVIQMRNRLAHSAIDDENVERLWNDSRAICRQLRRLVRLWTAEEA
jgi:uncharacterized protein with HEPN domain